MGQQGRRRLYSSSVRATGALLGLGLTLAVAASSVGAAPAAGEAVGNGGGAPLEISVDAGLVTLKAREVPLETVLGAMAEKGGFRLDLRRGLYCCLSSQV